MERTKIKQIINHYYSGTVGSLSDSDNKSDSEIGRMISELSTLNLLSNLDLQIIRETINNEPTKYTIGHFLINVIEDIDKGKIEKDSITVKLIINYMNFYSRELDGIYIQLIERFNKLTSISLYDRFIDILKTIIWRTK
jgi:hypothetical protein